MTPPSAQEATWDESRGRVWLPRWVIYAQATLLGVATLVAFVFGVMVGQVTAPSGVDARVDCQLRGVVRSGSDPAEGDAEAIIILLPADVQPSVRLDPESIAPGTFRALNNPVIDQIHAWGGTVTRTDDQGGFVVQLDSPRRYWMIAISQRHPRVGPLHLSRQEMAAIGKVFLPIEALFRDRRFSIRNIALNGEEQAAEIIEW